jgi:hypothetical protein
MQKAFASLQSHNLDSIAEMVIVDASKFWEEEPEDFCVQHVAATSIIFGGRNRIVWTPSRGFVIDLPYCGPAFIEHFRKIDGAEKFAETSWTVRDIGDLVELEYDDVSIPDVDIKRFMLFWQEKVKERMCELGWDVWKTFTCMDKMLKEQIETAVKAAAKSQDS